MKTILPYFSILLIGISLTSCIIETDDSFYNGVSLEQVLTDYDIWYVDYNRTYGSGEVPFVSKAFTLTFQNGRLYANNNLVGIGYTGNGYGLIKGSYNTQNNYLQINHSQDGYYGFDVIVDAPQSIRLYNAQANVTYYLEGYRKSNFDFDQVFYDNIEYFLQEYYAWEKTYTSIAGTPNLFDYENYLAFTPENNTTFYSSKDNTGTNIDRIQWDYTGSYQVYNVNGYDNLKILKLWYEPSGYEEFELQVIDDGAIELYHPASGTTYEFDGRGNIQFKKSGKNNESKNYSDRSRTKVTRNTVERNPLSKDRKLR